MVSIVLLTSCWIDYNNELVIKNINPITKKLYNEFDIFGSWCTIWEVNLYDWDFLFMHPADKYVIWEFTIKCKYDYFLK